VPNLFETIIWNCREWQINCCQIYLRQSYEIVEIGNKLVPNLFETIIWNCREWQINWCQPYLRQLYEIVDNEK